MKKNLFILVLSFSNYLYADLNCNRIYFSRSSNKLDSSNGKNNPQLIAPIITESTFGQKNLALESSKLDNEHYGTRRQRFLASKLDLFWMEKIKAINTEQEMLSIISDIFGGMSLMSSSQWKKVADAALPLLLNQVEALDNVGVLDANNIYEVFLKQYKRSENFNDQTYKETLSAHLSPLDSVGFDPLTRANFAKLLSARESVEYNFKRIITGSAAEQVYISLNIPEQKENGISYKILRSTDRSVTLVMKQDLAANTYTLVLQADTRSHRFSAQNSKLYRLTLTDLRIDDEFFIPLTPGAMINERLNAPYVLNYTARQISASMPDGTVPIEIMSVNNRRIISSENYQPQRGYDILIEVPKNNSTYQGGETVRARQDYANQEAKARDERRKRVRFSQMTYFERLFYDLGLTDIE